VYRWIQRKKASFPKNSTSEQQKQWFLSLRFRWGDYFFEKNNLRFKTEHTIKKISNLGNEHIEFDIKTYSCVHCGSSFETRWGLLRHLKKCQSHIT
jgi:hypothetical protein